MNGEFEKVLADYRLAEHALNTCKDEDSEAGERVQCDYIAAYQRLINVRASTGDQFVRKLSHICTQDDEFESLGSDVIKGLINEALSIGGAA
ncbi:hypothetical protein [Aquisediminimonas sediminicola]|uniref:hypothetical protein n=1 Tax=Alteraquisediminimonas sediminicola TaxID=2676787 RepID=UPI001C8DD82F|nr:hypothetical protein [Aquisediminimonas sediminicola]